MVEPIIYGVCLIVYHPKMCDHAVKMLIPTFFFNFFNKVISPTKICQFIKACPNEFEINNTQKYIDNEVVDMSLQE